MHSNVDVLTHAHAVLKAKARQKKNQIEHIAFDDEARHEFLTGFRKRNLLKKEAAKNKAKERERQDRLQARREQRQALQEQAKRNATLAEQAYRKAVVGDADDGDNEDDNIDGSETGFSPADKGKGKQLQDAFEDDEQLAIVTIVEEFDPQTLLHGPPTPEGPPSAASGSGPASHLSQTTSQHPKRPSASRRPMPDRVGEDHSERHAALKKSAANPKKKVAYETKAARKVQRSKQRDRRLEKASRAGGKPTGSRRDNTRSGGRKKGKK